MKRKLSTNASYMPKRSKTNLQELPSLVLLKIFSYLPYFPDVISSISRVCKKFNDLSSDKLLPTNLHVNQNLLKTKNIEPILKTISRAVSLRHFEVDLKASSYSTKSNIEQILSILQVISERIRSLRALRIGLDEVSYNYISTVESHRRLCVSLIKTSENNALEILELKNPISLCVLEELISNIKHSLRCLKFCVRGIPQGYPVFCKLYSYSKLEELHVDINNKDETAATYDGLYMLGDLNGLRKLVLVAQKEFLFNFCVLSETFFKTLVCICLINVAIHLSDAEIICKECTKLKEIEITLLKCSVDYLIENTPNTRHLEKFVTVNGTSLSQKGIKLISTWHSLRQLCIKSVADSKDLSSLDIITAFETGTLHNLVRCELDFTFLDDDCLKVICEQCSKLETLGITHSQKLSDNGIKYISVKGQNLKEILLEHCTKVSDNGVKELISNCKNLKLLNIKHTSVSQQYCDKELFIEETDVHCSHKACVNYKSEMISEYFDVDEYDDDSYSFKDYRYRR